MGTSVVKDTIQPSFNMNLKPQILLLSPEEIIPSNIPISVNGVQVAWKEIESVPFFFPDRSCVPSQ